jgi:ATP-dependent metalloprotease
MLFNLERLANNHPRNAEIQATYLQAVVTEDPQYVVRRYESGLYASSEECSRVYQKAKRLSASTHKSVSSDSLLGNRQERLLGAEQSSLGGLGTENKPLHVVQASSKGSFFWKQVFNALKYILGLIILVSVFDAAFQMRGMTANHKSILPDRSDRKYRFADVQGVDEAKEELQEVVEFLRSPDKFRRLGGKLPKGVLLIGPPGTGKTLLARAVAGEAGVPFFFCSGSEFDEMFVGVGAARVRNLFSAAKEHAPCIVFVDELDAIGGRRVKNDVQPYSRMTLNQLLVEMDGFEQNSGVVVIGATNFPEVLDEALVRPGRFDSKISITMPDVKARYDILKVHVKEVPLASDVDLEILARGTSGMTGADLAGLVNQAAIRSSALGHDDITMLELEWAKDKIIMGKLWCINLELFTTG